MIGDILIKHVELCFFRFISKVAAMHSSRGSLRKVASHSSAGVGAFGQL